MAASREKVLYFEPQPSEQTAALKTVLDTGGWSEDGAYDPNTHKRQIGRAHV